MANKIDFLSLSSTDVCISEISCVERHWKNKWENEYPSGRDQNVLSFTLKGHKRLYLPDESEPIFDVDSPAAFLISTNSPYISRSVSPKAQDGHIVCIKFKLTDQNGEAIKINEKYLCFKELDAQSFESSLNEIMDLYVRANTNTLAIKREVYHLLEKLVILSQNEQRLQEGFHNLSPAIKYLEKNLSSNVSVSDLAKMCIMSNSYFYKQFKLYTGGLCLTDYRNKMRVEKAKELLKSSLYSISLIAQTLGFYDVSHFYRVFKKHTGETPKLSK